MATIFKRTKRKHEPYTVQYVDFDGKRKTVKAFTDKGLSEQLAAQLEAEARMKRTGLVDSAQEGYLLHKQAPIDKHLEVFEKLQDGNSTKHGRLTLYRVRRVIELSGFGCLGDIAVDEVRETMETLRKTEDLGHRTYNHYLQACDCFLNWCVRSRRLLSNPIAGMPRLNPDTDVRHPRRALTPEEVSRLLISVSRSRKYYQRQSPQVRFRIYTIAYLTGLRKQELASLSPNSFKLQDNPPTLTIEAARSKHRKKDVLPLHPQLVASLGEWTEGMRPDQKLFPELGKKKLSNMVKYDLRDAGIPYKTHEGIADFHAAGRHTYITQLIRSGVSLPTAMELARHSDVKMTMRYTHIGIDDQAAALANLPSPQAEFASEADDALQMRCISGGAACHKVAEEGITEEAAKIKKRRKSNGESDFGVNCQGMADTLKAEGTGLEPATGKPATDFESAP